MKALIISVGTGTKQEKKVIRNLAEALAYSVKHHNPDKTFFIVTPESEKTTLPILLKTLNPKAHETLKIENADDIQNIYETLEPKIQQIRKNYTHLVIDYTSGTKAITAALAILATLYEANELSYITGKRKGGIVQPGTEQVITIRPYFATLQQKIKTAIQFFNKAQYPTAVTILKQIQKTTQDPKITTKITPLLKLAKSYALWDKFKHEKAFKTLQKIKMEELKENKRFLGKMLHSEEPEPYFIADLLNNAKRRGDEEERYDDAVARLYRTIELIAQYQLKRKYNIDTSNAKPEQIPQQLLEKWGMPPTKTSKIRLTLQKDYELLNAQGDPIGEKFVQDKKLKELLTKRNTSILAHNLKPVNKKTYKELYQKTVEYASFAVENLEHLIKSKTKTR